MNVNFNYLDKFLNKLTSAKTPEEKEQIIDSASNYVNSFDSALSNAIKDSGIDIFSSGSRFKTHITSQTGLEESIFTSAIDSLKGLDLSSDTIEKNVENKEDENYGFYSLMNEIYSNEQMSQTLDIDADGKISNKEAQDFINSIKDLDGDSKNVTLEDFAQFFDKVQTENKKGISGLFENFAKQWDSFTDNALKAIDAMKNQSALKPTGGGISQNPYITNNTNKTTSTTKEATKEDLTTQIEQYKQEISDIQANKQADVQNAIAEQETAKQTMEAQIEQDEKINQETKEQFSQVTNNLEKTTSELSTCEGEIQTTQASITEGENSISSLKSALSSLAQPTGKEEDKDSDAKLSARKQELESQIQDQENKNSELKTKLEELSTQKAQLDEQKTQLETQKAELQAQILQTCSEETKTAIENYDQKTQTVSEIKTAKLNEVQEKLVQAQSELKAIQDKNEQSKNAQAENTFDANFDEMLGHILGYEGGFSNHPADRGGATNYGITTATYRAYKNDPNADVRNITQEEVQEIYYKNYYQASGAEKYAQEGNKAYAFAVFDAAVNHGVGAAGKMDAQAGGDVDKFMELRKQKYINIVANNSSQKVFEKGWQNRWNNVYAYIDPDHKYENYIG